MIIDYEMMKTEKNYHIQILIISASILLYYIIYYIYYILKSYKLYLSQKRSC